MAGKRQTIYPPDEDIIAAAGQVGSIKELARVLGLGYRTFLSHLGEHHELKDKVRAALKPTKPTPSPFADLEERTHGLLQGKRRGDRVTVEELADELDVAPGRVRTALEGLRVKGYRIPLEEESGGSVSLERITPTTGKSHRLMFGGQTVRLGVVSDTHLNSNECALAELHLAYDRFDAEGIKRVFHAGDLTDGRGVYRSQDAEIINHTFETQAEFVEANYPNRKGITTHLIGGNHDLQGDFGRMGADLVARVSNARDDFDYLGPFSAWVNVAGEKNPCWIHLLHAAGGGAYAFSYQAQKLADGYPPGRKPAVLVPGHFHRKGNIEARGIEVLWPGCFQWQSSFMERKGLTPAVGFWIVEMTVGKDGSLVQLEPHWFRFFQGRTVGR